MNTTTKNCIIHCRVSDPSQALRGDGLDDQEKIGRAFAARNGWNVLKVFREPFSGKKGARAKIDEILLYIKKSSVPVNYYVFKSIDRFTRAGVPEYLHLKNQIETLGVEAVDSYGVIQPMQNTLEHLDEEYDWSKFSPSDTMQLMEASRAHADRRDILTRMVGAQIRRAKEGYLARRALDGYKSKKIYDETGKAKKIGEPDDRAKLWIEMYELRAAGNLTDQEIVDRLNDKGFKTKKFDRWNKEKTKVIGEGRGGGKPLTVKALQRKIQNPRYAGIACEKWTKWKPIRLEFKGLVSIDRFNEANRGKIVIKITGKGKSDVQLLYNQKPTTRLRNNPFYPNKHVLCPICRNEMLSSAPRSKNGKKSPRYHCGSTPSRKHAYFSIPKTAFDDQVKYFVEHLRFSSAFLADFEEVLVYRYHQKQAKVIKASAEVNQNLSELQIEKAAKLDAFGATDSQAVREGLTEQIEVLDKKIKSIKGHRNQLEITEQDIHDFVEEAKQIMEHPAKWLQQSRTLQDKLAIWGLVFDEQPTYTEIVNGTPKLSLVFNLSSDFEKQKSYLVTLRGIEPRFKP